MFDGVEFAYGRDVGGVQRIDLTVKPGEKLGIVGASGAGKSTLVSLLLRLYDSEGGEIRIDSQAIAGVTQDSLRRQIGMVTQETAMFNRSARDNILYGRPDATEAEVIAAAEHAEADEFINDLQDSRDREGYDAHLGERGVKLSGGQRQRIALARAILKDAPILVLDEATSALDSEVEASIQDALHKVMDGKTVLAIAHRLSTLSEMDRIIVMDAGRIVESGTHSDLLAKGGLYAQFWNRQSGGVYPCRSCRIRAFAEARCLVSGPMVTQHEILRLGHQGDGVAAGPVYAPATLPGETVSGTLSGTQLTEIRIETPLCGPGAAAVPTCKILWRLPVATCFGYVRICVEARGRPRRRLRHRGSRRRYAVSSRRRPRRAGAPWFRPGGPKRGRWPAFTRAVLT